MIKRYDRHVVTSVNLFSQGRGLRRAGSGRT